MVHSYASVEEKYEGDTLRFECMVCIYSKDRGCSEDQSDTVPVKSHPFQPRVLQVLDGHNSWGLFDKM
jgi:hypothetical protein